MTDDERNAAVLEYLARNWKPVPLKGKDAYRKGWPSLSFQPADFATGDNVGLNWERSGFVDLDFDIAEARLIAPHVLRVAPPGFGRASAPGGHLVVSCPDSGNKIVKYQLKNAAFAAERLGLKATTDDKLVVCEVRGKGQTMVPPSVHPSGEPVAWNAGAVPSIDDIPSVVWSSLLSEMRLIAFLAVVLRAYPRKGGFRNEIAMALAGALLGFGVDPARVPGLVETVAKLADDEEHADRKRSAEATVEKHATGEGELTRLPKLCELLDIEPLEPDFRKWFGVAKAEKAFARLGNDGGDLQQFLAGRNGARLLRWNGEWLSFENGAYRAYENEGVRAEVYRARPGWDRQAVDDFVDALKAHCFVDRNRLTPPCWIGPPPPGWGEASDPRSLIVLRNGVFDLESGALRPHTDQFFTRVALPFDYDPSAPPPTRWLSFLENVFPDEEDCRLALQLWFGYMLGGSTGLQCILVIVGPSRSGKGTIARVLVRLLGRDNVCAPTLDGLGAHFGLQSMIGRSMALIADMRMGPQTNKARVSEVLLRISGEDAMSVPRKNLTDWEGTLGVRFMILSNEPPTLNDPSGALAARWRVLQMRQSFVGREDRSLDAALETEMPGILNWAIEGARKLREIGRIEQPASSADAVDTIRRLGSPVVAFVADECDLEAQGSVSSSRLYDRYRTWCDRAGLNPLSAELFGKDLLTAFQISGVSKARVRVEGGERSYVYRGIKLTNDTGYPWQGRVS